MKLFRTVLDTLFPPRATEVLVRSATIETLGMLVAPLAIPNNEGETVALLPYRDPLVSALIVEAKYHGNHRACELLGGVLAEYLAAFLEDQDAYASRNFALLPIPLSKERLRERGYNQVERIVAYALSRLSLKDAAPTDVLVRIRNTPSQTTLSGKERRENMEGAFRAKNVDTSVSYVLIDDVITTGATFAAAAKALSDAGASRIIRLALSH